MDFCNSVMGPRVNRSYSSKLDLKQNMYCSLRDSLRSKLCRCHCVGTMCGIQSGHIQNEVVNLFVVHMFNIHITEVVNCE